jgi:NhaP-type Na+/H+ or K+/H+ antiporter
MHMQLYNALAIITVLAALFSYINYRFIKLPDIIGVMIISLVASLAILGIGLIQPGIFRDATTFIRSIDFYTILIKIMLSFLLFAGAIHINARELRQEINSILTFSTISVLISTALVGSLLYLLCRRFQQPVGFLLLRTIDYYQVEVMITLALVMGGYLLADKLRVSGPLAMVVAGIITGNKTRLTAMSTISRDYIDKFWGLVDNLLNAILFLLIGLEMLVIPFTPSLLWLGLASILVVLLARYVSVSLPISLLKYNTCFEKNAIGILTWGGLRGGLSVALALSVPANMHGDLFVVITYIVVLFSIIVQGLTIGRFTRKVKTH